MSNFNIEELERKRSEVYAAYKKDMLVGCLTAIFLVGIFFIVRASTRLSKFKAEYKDQVGKAVVENKFVDGQYFPKGGFSWAEIKDAGFYKDPDRHVSRDKVAGKIDDVKFEMSYVELIEKRVRSNGKTTTVEYIPYFKGRWFIFDFERNLNQKVLVMSGKRGNHHLREKLQKAETESIEFSKQFKIFTTDQHKVFYLLTPAVIETIKALDKKYPGAMNIAFINGRVHVSLYDRNYYMRVRVNKPLNQEVIDGICSNLNVVEDLIHELKLNTQKFKDS